MNEHSNINRTADRAAALADRKTAERRAARSIRRALFADIAQETLRRPMALICGSLDRQELVRAYAVALADLATQEMGGVQANSLFGSVQFKCTQGPERPVFSFEGGGANDAG